MDLNQVISSIILPVGGTGAIIVGLGAWLGKLWANRILDIEKARHARELEKLKSELEFEKLKKRKISDERFKLYNEVWHAFQDLKSIADRLWERATPEILHEFVVALAVTKRAANRARLILTENHFRTLKRVLESFENYRLGKNRLIEIRSKRELKNNYSLYHGGENEVTDQIHENLRKKNEYDLLLDKIVNQFRVELGLAE